MRMPADQLGGDRLDHVAEIERALLLRHTGVEDDLQQQIAKFVLKVGKIVARNGIRDLVGFFERIGCDGREVLLQIPRAAGLGRPQCRHDFDQPADVAGRSYDGSLTRASPTLSDPLKTRDQSLRRLCVIHASSAFQQHGLLRTGTRCAAPSHR